MADTPRAKIEEKGHKPDVSDTNHAHCEHCEAHHKRLSTVEAKLGIKAQPGAAKEETGVHKEKKPNYTRRRH